MIVATQFWWFAARSSGIVAWALLAGSVLWGLALSTRVFGKNPRPNWILDFHRFLGGLAVVFVGIHIVALIFDSYVTFGAVEILIPFASKWHRVAVAWGVIAMYLLLAVEVTSLFRSRLSKQVWRSVHYASFPLFALAIVHSLWAGTDRHTFLMRYGFIAATIVILVLTAIRLQKAERHDLMASPRVAGSREQPSRL